MKTIRVALISALLALWMLPLHAYEPFNPDVDRVGLLLDAEVSAQVGPARIKSRRYLPGQSLRDPRIIREVVGGVGHGPARANPTGAVGGVLPGTRAGRQSPRPRGRQRPLGGSADRTRTREPWQGRAPTMPQCLGTGQAECVRLTWELASYYALLEGLDELVPEVDRALAAKAASSEDEMGKRTLVQITLRSLGHGRVTRVASIWIFFQKLVTDPRGWATRDRDSSDYLWLAS